MDHMRRGTLNLDDIRFFVLDEADEMLDMGFIEDIEWILEQVPAERQTALFSATMPPRIADLAARYMRDPQRITVAGKQMTVPRDPADVYYEVPRARKVDALTRILDAETPHVGDDLLPHQARRRRAGRGADGPRLRGRDAPRRPLPGAARPGHAPLPQPVRPTS